MRFVPGIGDKLTFVSHDIVHSCSRNFSSR